MLSLPPTARAGMSVGEVWEGRTGVGRVQNWTGWGVMWYGEAVGGDGSGGNDMHQILPHFSAASLTPFSPRICASEIISVDLKKPMWSRRANGISIPFSFEGSPSTTTT